MENTEEIYTDFARVYDELMDNTPYEMWCNRLDQLIASYGVSRPTRDAEGILDTERNLVVDLGCGTGTMTRLLRQKGYDMIGVDASAEMLEIARNHPDEGILYLQQDMREFELYGTVAAVVCVCDSLNYLLEEEDLAEVFSLVHNYLDQNGVFIFDMNTIHKYRDLIGDATICENREEGSFIWENYFDEESSINEYALTLFVKQENGLFARFEEFHYQRAYELQRVAALLEQAGLTLKAVCAEGTTDPADENCERAYFVAVRTQPHVF